MADYLVGVAEAMTARAPVSLPPKENWETWRQARKQKFLEFMGLDLYFELPRTPLYVNVTQVHVRDGYRIECLSYESLPGLHVAANLYVPNDAQNAPAMLYVCGHAKAQKAWYQEQARRYAQLGFVTLIVDTVQWGEVEGYHHGTYAHGWFNWISRGYTPAAVEVWNGVRGLDLLEARKEVDPKRLGLTGTSGGGAITWFLAAADDRVAVLSASCGSSTVASHIREGTLDGHCDCMFPNNPEGWELIDFAALVAPRPCLVVSPDRDPLFAIDGIHDFYNRLAGVYEHLGAGQEIDLVTFRATHSYKPVSRRATFRWFVRHLQGKDEQPGDFDGHREDEKTLAVYGKGQPPNDRSATVQDWLIPLAQPPRIHDAAALAEERERVVRALKAQTFATFPKSLLDPGVQVVHEFLDSDDITHTAKFRYTPEVGWRLAGTLETPAGISGTAPVVVELLGPASGGRTLAADCPANWRRSTLSLRGSGATSTGDAIQWHLRRAAALTGRTLASLRVLDALQGLRAVRSMAGVDPDQVYVAARGEMSAVALYAALLDGKVAGVILNDPPATQDLPGRPDGTGPALEMINCLRITDLPQVAGLLWPARLVFAGARPSGYVWAEDLYRTLGAPGGFWTTRDLRTWRAD